MDDLGLSTPESRMKHVADTLAAAAELELSLTADQVGAVAEFTSRQAEARVLRRRLLFDIARGLFPPDTLDQFDNWAAEYVGEPPDLHGERC